MQPLSSLFADYASYHRTPGNKLFHRFGIPLIVLSALGMLARVSIYARGPGTPPPHLDGMVIDLAMVLIVLSGVYYIALNWKLGVAMVIVSILLYIAGSWLPLWANVALFVLGWIFQGIGHSVYEKRRPAFLRNGLHLLIGPLWILNDVIPVVKP